MIANPRLLALVLVSAVPARLVTFPAWSQTKQRFDYADTKKPVEWTSGAPRTSWAADGKHVEVRREKAVWIDVATGAESEPQKVEAEPKPAPARASLRDGKLALTPATDGKAKSEAIQLLDAGKDAREAHASGDGKFASFVRGNDLYVVDVATKSEWRVTSDGGPDRFNGLLDWVYQEELYGRGDFQGHWWSSNASAPARCAFLSLDEAPVKEFTIVDEVPKGFLDEERGVTTEVANYPKAGDPNPIATLSIADPVAKKVTPVDLSAWPKDLLIARVEWTPDGKTLLVTLQDRVQTWAKLVGVDPTTGKATTWIEEASETWVDRPESPRWLDDGTFLWLSARSGYQHLYRYAPGGALKTTLTSGPWQVRAIERVDEKLGVVFFEGSKDGVIDRNVYRVGLDGKGLVRLTQGAGTHSIELSKDGSTFLDRWSSMSQPPVARVCKADDGAVVRELWRAGKGDAEKYAFSEKQRLAIPARDGFLLDASLQMPTEVDPARKYAVFVPTYSGPDTPSVRDAWSHSTYTQFLCQQGFIVLQVNVRTASGIGRKETGTCYRDLGAQELKDLEDAVDDVCAKHQGDPARVAIQGWSYGGFMTAYALTHSKKFALGLAGAGVYDWRLYDTIYTERYMRTPQENKAGYDASSVIKHAKDLSGHLVLVHGTMDDNVHLQNTIQLLWELEKTNKHNFELMLYPRSQHGLSPEVGAHEKELEWRALKRLLDPAFKAE